MNSGPLVDPDEARWRQIAAQARQDIETRLFIGGEFVDAVRGGHFETVNPANGEVIAAMAEGTAEDIDRAVQVARQTFRSGVWSRMAPRSRMDVLYRFADLIEAHSERLAVLETLDMGKPIRDAIADDLPAVVETVRFMAECIDKIEGAVTHTEDDVIHFVLREPLGVVGAISPWNYPLLMATWKIARHEHDGRPLWEQALWA